MITVHLGKLLGFDDSILFSYPKKSINDGRLLIVDLITMPKLNNYSTIWILMFMLNFGT
jgi:hypothetical protein